MNDSELAKQIGKAARAARDALGLSQADVAERVEISTEFYGRLERGVTLPSVPTLAKVAAVLAVTADTLMGTGARQ
jgi:transcriptional regulator with XRE-family HTH domain